MTIDIFIVFAWQISSIFYYLCVVTLQFAAPLILCLYLTLMYKSLGGFTWTGIFKETAVLQHECAADGELATTPKDTNVEEAEFNILESAQSLQASFASLKNVRVFISNSYFLPKLFVPFRCSPRKCTRAFWASPPGGATLRSLRLLHWASSISPTSTRHNGSQQKHSPPNPYSKLEIMFLFLNPLILFYSFDQLDFKNCKYY